MKRLKTLLAATLVGCLFLPVAVSADTLTLTEKEHQAVETMKEVWNFEEGCLAEGADEETLEKAKDFIELLPEENDHRQNLADMVEAAEAELSKPDLTYYGNCVITHYCNGPCCCGVWAYGNTASGVPPVANHTVAHNYLPFGTRVLIDGQEYVVEDRGGEAMAGGDWFDIYIPDHNDATKRGMRRTDVYIING